MSGKLTIRNYLAITAGIAIAFALVFAPFTPSVSLSDFKLVPIEDETQHLPDVRVSVTNNGVTPIWLQGSRFGSDLNSHVRCFFLRDCRGQEWGDMRTNIQIESDNLRINRGETVVVHFEAFNVDYQSASLYLQFKDWRGRLKVIKCGEFNLDELATVSKNQNAG